MNADSATAPARVTDSSRNRRPELPSMKPTGRNTATSTAVVAITAVNWIGVRQGARAQNWLRQEKSYRAFGTELGRDATPLEAGLDRFVDLGKEFRGKAAMQAKGIRSTCVTLLIDGPADADPWGREALYDGGTKVGRLTSGGYSVAVGRSGNSGRRSAVVVA